MWLQPEPGMQIRDFVRRCFAEARPARPAPDRQRTGSPPFFDVAFRLSATFSGGRACVMVWRWRCW